VTGDLVELAVQIVAARARQHARALDEAVDEPAAPHERGMEAYASQPPPDSGRTRLLQSLRCQPNGHGDEPGEEHEEKNGRAGKGGAVYCAHSDRAKEDFQRGV